MLVYKHLNYDNNINLENYICTIKNFTEEEFDGIFNNIKIPKDILVINKYRIVQNSICNVYFIKINKEYYKNNDGNYVNIYNKEILDLNKYPNFVVNIYYFNFIEDEYVEMELM